MSLVEDWKGNRMQSATFALPGGEPFFGEEGWQLDAPLRAIDVQGSGAVAQIEIYPTRSSSG